MNPEDREALRLAEAEYDEKRRELAVVSESLQELNKEYWKLHGPMQKAKDKWIRLKAQLKMI